MINPRMSQESQKKGPSALFILGRGAEPHGCAPDTMAPLSHDPLRSEESAVSVTRPEYSRAHRMIAAGMRLREAWAVVHLDLDEIHEAVMSLLSATGTKDLAAALGVLHDIEEGYGHQPT